jgi:hypothetical protein
MVYGLVVRLRRGIMNYLDAGQALAVKRWVKLRE